MDAAQKALSHGADLGLSGEETLQQKLKKLQGFMFDANVAPTLTQKSPGNSYSQFPPDINDNRFRLGPGEWSELL